MQDDDWAEYKRLVLSELGSLKVSIDNLSLKVDSLRQDMILLKAKGALASLIISLVVSSIITAYALKII